MSWIQAQVMVCVNKGLCRQLFTGISGSLLSCILFNCRQNNNLGLFKMKMSYCSGFYGGTWIREGKMNTDADVLVILKR